MGAEHVVRRVVVAGQQPAAVGAVQGRCGTGALAVTGLPGRGGAASARFGRARLAGAGLVAVAAGAGAGAAAASAEASVAAVSAVGSATVSTTTSADLRDALRDGLRAVTGTASSGE
ncbi:hypothetical protein [Streptomyces sp. YPW6]|uniref:hypothetical protein n=1 Tax=Streptomyces sp. YPW6 TaxID=2840373 RepID=UPI00209AA6BA|nr:hypothetical protein [Streptomyces sp. YPW6]